jgi:hypothetical protein
MGLVVTCFPCRHTGAVTVWLHDAKLLRLSGFELLQAYRQKSRAFFARLAENLGELARKRCRAVFRQLMTIVRE